MKKLEYIFLFIACFLITGYSAISQTKTKVDLAKLDAYFAKALTDWNVPGMAIAIVKDDSVVLAKGYGVRNINNPKEKVDEKTLFPIASNTKAFTAAALAMLVDDGKINWDDKVIKYLPWFQLYDPYVTNNMTIRDLLCHRSGLETFSGDLVWYGTNYTREEVIKRARFLKPKYGFREHFGYSNIMFVTAGQIIPVVTGKSWDDFIQEKFLTPLGMKTSNTSISKLDPTLNVASAHTEKDGKVISIPFLNWDNVGPAGAINSNVIEMSSWIKLQLHRGTLNGKKYFSEESNHEMWSPQTNQTVSENSLKRFPSTHFKSYGLGWGLNDYLGRKIVDHSGGYDGVISYVCLVPEEKLGFVILTNCNSSLYYPLVYKILDTYLGGEEKDWSKTILEISNSVKKSEADEKIKKEAERVKNTKPTLQLKDYCGTYTSELYGDATVEIINNELSLKLLPAPLFVGNLSHWHYDTFQIEFKNFPSLPDGLVNFTIDQNAKVEKMRIDIPNPDFDFTELDFIKK